MSAIEATPVAAAPVTESAVPEPTVEAAAVAGVTAEDTKAPEPAVEAPTLTEAAAVPIPETPAVEATGEAAKPVEETTEAAPAEASTTEAKEPETKKSPRSFSFKNLFASFKPGKKDKSPVATPATETAPLVEESEAAAPAPAAEEAPKEEEAAAPAPVVEAAEPVKETETAAAPAAEETPAPAEAPAPKEEAEKTTAAKEEKVKAQKLGRRISARVTELFKPKHREESAHPAKVDENPPVIEEPAPVAPLETSVEAPESNAPESAAHPATPSVAAAA